MNAASGGQSDGSAPNDDGAVPSSDSPIPNHPAAARRVLAIGLDGATFDVLDR